MRISGELLRISRTEQDRFENHVRWKGRLSTYLRSEKTIRNQKQREMQICIGSNRREKVSSRILPSFYRGGDWGATLYICYSSKPGKRKKNGGLKSGGRRKKLLIGKSSAWEEPSTGTSARRRKARHTLGVSGHNRSRGLLKDWERLPETLENAKSLKLVRRHAQALYNDMSALKKKIRA